MEKNEVDTRPIHIRQETHQRLKEFCWNNGMKIYVLADKVLTKYLDSKLSDGSENKPYPITEE